MTSKQDLTVERIKSVQPRYLFFPHWSWIVPGQIIDTCECVLFHMTDVPYGRGGSPLQNLIVRGHNSTKLSAIRMVTELDAGPVYLKRDLPLSGTARQIFRRASSSVMQMIEEIVVTQPTAIEQTGEVTLFRRRTPEMSRLPKTANLKTLYDHIRMLDAPGYPHAFVDVGDLRLELDNACLRDNKLCANVSISLGSGSDGKSNK